ncbi:hypothetical protein B0H67DRAFT_72508 [Lasiosphaeris hirsuta]|uniref:Uncharacterized protein n=1 Tax=Lasiosphaeris hirsuta TaxID=260670 RepID=A0AA40BBW9_9PEZI|nr:hypothetical protein B0H67DRAFT_72508 [Lasiosphaeris hirsuta]
MGRIKRAGDRLSAVTQDYWGAGNAGVLLYPGIVGCERFLGWLMYRSYGYNLNPSMIIWPSTTVNQTRELNSMFITFVLLSEHPIYILTASPH